MKKTLVALMAVLILVFNGTGALAQSTPVIQGDSDCDCGEETSLTEIPDGITELSDKAIKKNVGKLHKEKSYREALKWFKANGLEVSDIVAGLRMDELVFDSGETLNNVNHIAFNGISDDKKNRGLIVAIVDNETNALLHLKADVFYSISENGFEAMQTYTSQNGLGDKVTKAQLDEAKEDEVKTMAFTPCQHASVWICIYHCGMWALAHPAAGIACGAVCGYAFNYACSK